MVTDNLDGVLISTYGTVCTETPELTSCGAFRSGSRVFFNFKGKTGNVIVDTDGETCLFCIVEYSDDLTRCGVLTCKTVTAAEYRNVSELGFLNSCNYV